MSQPPSASPARFGSNLLGSAGARQRVYKVYRQQGVTQDGQRHHKVSYMQLVTSPDIMSKITSERARNTGPIPQKTFKQAATASIQRRPAMRLSFLACFGTESFQL
eukprot:6490517-Amphidinium_carterae.1